jgi:hypothetical protein
VQGERSGLILPILFPLRPLSNLSGNFYNEITLAWIWTIFNKKIKTSPLAGNSSFPTQGKRLTQLREGDKPGEGLQIGTLCAAPGLRAVTASILVACFVPAIWYDVRE